MGSAFLEDYRAEAPDVLSAILGNSRDSITLLNRDGAIEYVSASAEHALGLTDDREAVGKPWRAFWPESAHQAVDSAILSAASGASAGFEGSMQSEAREARLWEATVSPVRGDGGAITHLLAVCTDVTAQRALAQDDRQRWQRAEERVSFAGDVALELRHRIKNLLAVVNAVTKLLARHTDSARDLALKLEKKLIALAHAQDLLAIRHDHPLSTREAVSEILKASGAGDRVEVVEMPEVGLPDEMVQQLALLLGELQTNALKHGALRHDRGRVQLSGSADGGIVTLRWAEDCGAPVTPVETGNGGFQLIRRLGASGGKQPTIVWLPSGIAVEFHMRGGG